MMRNCDTEKYAHSMTKANISLPWSWNLSALATCDIGWNLTSSDIIRIVKAMVERPWPPSVSTPKIVEYQCGSSDMTQSMLMNVIVPTKSTRPGSGNHARPAIERARELRGLFVLFLRPLVEEEDQHGPDREVEQRPDAEEALVEVGALQMDRFLDRFVVRAVRIGAHPRVERLEVEPDRQEQQRHQRQRARATLRAAGATPSSRRRPTGAGPSGCRATRA